jgi:phosphotransferase system enzyme I (PtsI)
VERLIGLGVSAGAAVGRAVVLTQRSRVVRFSIVPARVEDELAAIDRARERSRAQLQEIRAQVARLRGHELAALFDAQLLILDDPLFLGRAREIVRGERVNAAWAVHRAYEELCEVFATVEDPYLREREGDVADVAGRLRMNLRRGDGGDSAELLRDLDGPCVLVADELTASLAAQLDWTRLRGFATDAGSRTYHTAILARSLKVPAVVGLHDASARIAPGTLVLLDGTTGELTLEPSPAEVTAAEHRMVRRTVALGVAGAVDGPAVTRDGVAVSLQANVELLEDLPSLAANGAEGVGLYRSEFMLSGRAVDAVTEEQQFATYRDLLVALAPRTVTVRTFDVDERQAGVSTDHRRGRAGLRGLRLGLARPELLRTQLRALLRAAPFGTLRIMFPFVTSIEELRAARAVLQDVAREVGFSGRVPVGAMIEVPAAAVAADIIAVEADFLTIGTNDLIQYLLAVDRIDERVSDFYEPLHPAVLRLLRFVRRSGARRGIPVAVCGEMASDPALLGVLIGLGLTEFSMTPAALPVARQVVRDLRASDARQLARDVLRLATAAEVEQFLFDALAATTAQDKSRR